MVLAESEEKGNLRRDMAGACPHSGLGETDTAAIVIFFPICLFLAFCTEGSGGFGATDKQASTRQAWHELVWDHQSFGEL